MPGCTVSCASFNKVAQVTPTMPAASASYSMPRASATPVSRGYTDHEHLPDISLINMNGRMYDPEVGRFLSADPLIPELFRTQALNRYSYVYNNPGTLIDPTGYDASSILAPVTGNPYIDIPVQIFLGGIFGELFGDHEDRPPKHYKPGLGSVTENWRGFVPLRDVTMAANASGVAPGMSVAQASAAEGTSELGGAKFTGGSNSWAFSYTQAEAAAPTPRHTIEPIHGRPIVGLFKYLIREITFGVVLGDTGSEPALKPSPQTEADIDAYLATTSPAERAAMVLISPNRAGVLRTTARTLSEQLVLQEAVAGAGERIMRGQIKDPKYPENIWKKMQHIHENPDGTTTIIHYWENIETGVREGFKFK